jgi:hypothetical protein
MLRGTPTRSGPGTTTLAVVDWDLAQPIIAEYELRYLPDTNEVVLLKHDAGIPEAPEAVYSELLS